jgi:restriction system protein
MKKESLFGLLSRSPWWVSLLIAGGLFAGLRLFVPALVASSAALPFLGIAAYAGWRRWRVPGENAVTKRMDKLRAASWEDFSTLMLEAFRRDGYEVARLPGGTADFELKKSGRMTLASCKRWKVAQTGIGPLRELVQAREAREADECLYLSAGGFTPQAQAFAAENRVRLLAGSELARLVARVRSKKRSSIST